VSDVVIGWAASTAVTAATIFVVSKMTTRKTAAFVTPLVLLLAHRSLDAPVAQRLRSTLGLTASLQGPDHSRT
jgi:hypothetical protein